MTRKKGVERVVNKSPAKHAPNAERNYYKSSQTDTAGGERKEEERSIIIRDGGNTSIGIPPRDEKHISPSSLLLE